MVKKLSVLILLIIVFSLTSCLNKEQDIPDLPADEQNYADVSNNVDELNNADEPQFIKIGDIIEFGGYSWVVLDVRDEALLIITERVIKFMPYHNHYENWDENITWKKSDIRKWLNDDFYNSINESERTRIIETHVINDKSPWSFGRWDGESHGIRGGNDTTDKIFLLSINEVVQYFGDSGALEKGTNENRRDVNMEWPDYGAYFWGIHDQYSEIRIAQNFKGEDSIWWLRSPGNHIRRAALVCAGGYIDLYGVTAYVEYGIRPALWLTIHVDRG